MALVKKTPVKKIAVKTVVKKAVVAKVKVTKPAVKKAVVKEMPKETGLKISVYSTSGKVLESITLPKEVFGAKINNNLMTQAVRVYMANQRRGTLKTKTRGEVKISTRKIYRQKGTGRARHGAKSAPIFVGGGVAFGPRPRDFSLKLNQKSRKAALFSALSSRLKDGEIKIVTGLEKLEPKTKKMADVLKTLSLSGKNKNLLLVIPTSNDFKDVVKAARNIKGVTIAPSNLLNTYQVLVSDNLLFMKSSIETLKQNFLKEN